LTFRLRPVIDIVSVDFLQPFRLILDAHFVKELSMAKQRYQTVVAVRQLPNEGADSGYIGASC
jgi:hypothetical protein